MSDSKRSKFISVLEKLQNTLRDGEGIKGLTAFRCIISFFQLRFIEDILREKYPDISDKCYFSKCLEFVNEHKGSIICEYFMGRDETEKIGTDTVWGILLRNKDLCKYFQREVVYMIRHPATIKEFLVGIDKIFPSEHKINDETFDIFGDAYEEFISREMSAGGRALGQFFTPRPPIRYMVSRTKPKIGEKILDPSCGMCGFLIEAHKYIVDNYDLKKKHKEKLRYDMFYGWDIDKDIKSTTMFNTFIHGINDVGKKGEPRIETCNSFDRKPKDEYNVILANPPYGMKGVKVADNKYYRIKTGKGEELFVMLIYNGLKKGGRGNVIIPDGVLQNSNKSATELRKILLTKCKLVRVTSFPPNTFTNSGVKTSAIEFIKGEETDEVEFAEVKMNDSQIDYSDFDEDKMKITKVDFEKIEKNNYSLRFEDYNEENKDKKIEGIEYKKLSEICDFGKKSHRRASFGKDVGEYSFYSSSEKVKKCDEYDYDEEYIILGTGGNANIKINNKFSCSADNILIKTKDDDVVSNKYIYYYILNNKKILEDGFKGATIKHISKSYIENIEIPILPIGKQKKIIKKLEEKDYLIDKLKEEIEKTKATTKLVLEKYLKSDRDESDNSDIKK